MTARVFRSLPVVACLSATLATPLAAQEPALNVLATVGMIGSLAQDIAGECAQVQTLMGAGVDPHEYSATPGDVDLMSQADLILYVDRAFEERLADVLERLGARVATLGVAQASLAPDALLADGSEGGFDPHVWMDVSRWSQTVPVIAQAITDQRPDCAPAIAANVASLQAELAALHGWVGQAIASIPETGRVLVTAHDAFGYFTDAYGIATSDAIQGISTASEASIADIRDVASLIVDSKVPAVFVETTINPRTIEALVDEVRSRGHEVSIGGALFSDAMGDPGTPEGSYVGMIRANTLTITQALGGTAPDWPAALQGWAERMAVPQ